MPQINIGGQGLPRSSSSPTSTHRIEKGGCKWAKPSRGGQEHDVTNFRKALRSALVKSFSRMSHSQTMTFASFKDFSKKKFQKQNSKKKIFEKIRSKL